MKKLMRKSKGSWVVVSLGTDMLFLNGPVANAEDTVNQAVNDVTVDATLNRESQLTEAFEQSTDTVPTELILEETTNNSSTEKLSDTLLENLDSSVEASDDTPTEATDIIEIEAPQDNPSNEAITETETQAETEVAKLEVVTLNVRTLVAAAETPAKTHTVKSGEYLYLIAERYGITVAQLKQWNNLTSNYIYSGDQLKVSAGSTTTKPGDTNTTKPTDNTETTTNAYYTVRPGDYLWKIANQHGITVAQLKTWNNLTSNYIYSGDRFIVSKITTTPTQPEIPKEPEKPIEIKPESPKEPEKPTTSQPTPSTPTPTYYTVKSGDYLWKIATQYGITVNQLKSWNIYTERKEVGSSYGLVCRA